MMEITKPDKLLALQPMHFKDEYKKQGSGWLMEMHTSKLSTAAAKSEQPHGPK